MFKNFFADGTPDTERQQLKDSYDKYKNYKLPLRDKSGASLDYNIICPNIKNIGDGQGEKYTDCRSNINIKYKELRDEYILERYKACSKLTGSNQNDCKKNDMSLLNLQTQQGPDNDMFTMRYIDPSNNIHDNEENMKQMMNDIDYKKIANTYANNVTALYQKLDQKLENAIDAYKKLYNIFKSGNKSGVGQVTDLQGKIKNLLIVNKDYVLKDKKKQYKISNVNLRLSGHYNELSSTLELYKPIIWYLYWILFVVLIVVMIIKKTWSNITSYAFVFTLLFVPTLIMNPLIRLILSNVKNEKLDGITIAFTAFVLLLLSLLFFTNRLALKNFKGVTTSKTTPTTKTIIPPTPTPPTKTPPTKTPVASPSKTPTMLKNK